MAIPGPPNPRISALKRKALHFLDVARRAVKANDDQSLEKSAKGLSQASQALQAIAKAKSLLSSKPSGYVSSGNQALADEFDIILGRAVDWLEAAAKTIRQTGVPTTAISIKSKKASALMGKLNDGARLSSSRASQLEKDMEQAFSLQNLHQASINGDKSLAQVAKALAQLVEVHKHSLAVSMSEKFDSKFQDLQTAATTQLDQSQLLAIQILTNRDLVHSHDKRHAFARPGKPQRLVRKWLSAAQIEHGTAQDLIEKNSALITAGNIHLAGVASVQAMHSACRALRAVAKSMAAVESVKHKHRQTQGDEDSWVAGLEVAKAAVASLNQAKESFARIIQLR